MNIPIKLESKNSSLKDNKVSWRRLAQSSSVAARTEIPYEFAKHLNILPISILEHLGELELLIAIPAEENRLDISSQLKLTTNLRTRLIEVEGEVISKAISSAYFKNLTDLIPPKAKDLNELSDKKVNGINLISENTTSDEDNSTQQLLSLILNNAYANLASDIHIESKKGGQAGISFRCSGKLTKLDSITLARKQYEALIRFVKILCNLDITEHKKPQEGMFECTFHELEIRIRVSIIPSLYGSKIAFRILHHYLLDELQKKPTNRVKELGLNQEQEEIFRQKIKQKGGLILISGPTGSGKSTLLYSLIESGTPQDWNILSLEDPVEREISSITQIEVKSERPNAYLDALKSLLRQDPDMILISEIRDANVLETTIQAALSGIMVASTIHASRTLELILRLFELGCTPITLGAVLKLTSSQRLIPKNCSSCAKSISAEEKIYKYFSIPQTSLMLESTGCQKCNYQKSSGLIAVYETCCPTLQLISQIYFSFKEGMSTELMTEISNEFQKTHFIPFQMSIRNLLLHGKISPSTALLFLN